MPVTEKSFLLDVKDHEMVILKQDGLYRHVSFGRPNVREMYFELITWPGHLCYTGDMGTYVFKRIGDMFNFFRAKDIFRSKNSQDSLNINPQYWAEKVIGEDPREGIKQFSPLECKRALIKYLVDWMRYRKKLTTKKQRRELWEAVIDTANCIEYESSMVLAHDFKEKVNKDVGYFEFHDFYASDFQVHTDRFLWVCYAISWAIEMYDNQIKSIPN